LRASSNPAELGEDLLDIEVGCEKQHGGFELNWLQWRRREWVSWADELGLVGYRLLDAKAVILSIMTSASNPMNLTGPSYLFRECVHPLERSEGLVLDRFCESAHLLKGARV